jgi:hypothetical protein
MPVPAASPPVDPNLYLHIRVLIGIILGLAVTRLVAGVGGLIEKPGRRQLWLVHLGWVAWALLEVLAFWWWEFRLSHIAHWSLGLYAFVFVYACMYYLLAVLIFPDDIDSYDGFQAYFLSRRAWFFGLAAATAVMDVVDTAIKGGGYLGSLGWEYPVRIAGLILLFGLGAWTRDLRAHKALVVIVLIYEISYFWRVYNVIQ